MSLRRRSVALIARALTAVLVALPTAAYAQSTVSGEAFGVSASSLLVNLTEFPEVVLAPEGGSASAAGCGPNQLCLLCGQCVDVPFSICGNLNIEPGEVCELPQQGCGPLALCALCQQCVPLL